MEPPGPTLHLALPDGSPVLVRPVGPIDRGRLVAGLDALSEASRALRFLAPLAALSEAQLDYLTRVDGHTHVAWGALDVLHPDAPGLGVGRFVRFPDDPACAEFSLTVVDAAQGRGVGGLLLAVLYAEAARLRVRLLRGVVARENERMRAWLEALGARCALGPDALTLDLPVRRSLTPVAETPAGRHFATRVREVQAALKAAEDRG